MRHVTTASFDADPEALSRLSGRTTEAVDAVTDAITTMVTAVQLDPAAFGPTASGRVLHGAAARAGEAAHAAVGTIAEVWELDADNVLQAAVAYHETDLDEAARLRARGHRMEPR